MKLNYFLLLILISLFFICCENDDLDPIDTQVYEGVIQTNPQNFPSGGGIDFDANETGQIAQLDTAASFQFDLKIIAYRTAEGGRPAVFLFGDETNASSVMALDISSFSEIGTEPIAFQNFQEITAEMINALEPDGVFDFEPEVDLDAQGRPILEILEDAFSALVIGDKVVRLDEVDQPVFLIQTREGKMYKFQHVSREGGGAVTIRWARLK
ncbi:hypothetical protein [Algoriphagus pacificus]|uniref:Uncharacterized protein n=1 Tax=Algoriphagus pacificus TaxID=2811234 RepID=A0ABS3CKJ0_9BACT|nr:hypothetical protein [Algoriphagus pacificus]MBN7817001.1 hypothetical protein [Algoriphagus pacificus]